ncbi:hypothetical protein D9Q81_05850 [Candidatus Korarchaeum cryptofilum]|uniref:Uncharacterized protein n=1 Tax=Candidatus Korarchaeum cryptofilum TaxID=498846 RepID=A0A3R9QRU0_9CREN|nr:hypothetical protein D9Q81_05850 [Candidatus Korarchaeum cryptofilum]
MGIQAFPSLPSKMMTISGFLFLAALRIQVGFLLQLLFSSTVYFSPFGSVMMKSYRPNVCFSTL